MSTESKTQLLEEGNTRGKRVLLSRKDKLDRIVTDEVKEEIKQAWTKFYNDHTKRNQDSE